MTKVSSEEFQEILCTDPTTVEGEAKVVKYFNIADEWANVNSLTAIRVPAGTKNSRPVGIVPKVLSTPNTTNPQTSPP